MIVRLIWPLCSGLPDDQFKRWTSHKTIKTESIKFMLSSTLESVEFVQLNLNLQTRAVRLPRTDRTCEDRLWDKRWSFYESNLMNKLHFALFGVPLTERFDFATLNLFQRIMLDVWPNGRLLPVRVDQNCCLSKLYDVISQISICDACGYSLIIFVLVSAFRRRSAPTESA